MLEKEAFITLKLNTKISDILEGLPKFMIYYFEYVWQLSQTENPDYLYLERLFRSAIQKKEIPLKDRKMKYPYHVLM